MPTAAVSTVFDLIKLLNLGDTLGCWIMPNAQRFNPTALRMRF